MCESLGKVNSTRKLTEVTGVLAHIPGSSLEEPEPSSLW